MLRVCHSLHFALKITFLKCGPALGTLISVSAQTRLALLYLVLWGQPWERFFLIMSLIRWQGACSWFLFSSEKPANTASGITKGHLSFFKQVTVRSI